MSEKSIKEQLRDAEDELQGLLEKKIKKLKKRPVHTKYGLVPRTTIDPETGKLVKNLDEDS